MRIAEYPILNLLNTGLNNTRIVVLQAEGSTRIRYRINDGLSEGCERYNGGTVEIRGRLRPMELCKSNEHAATHAKQFWSLGDCL
jgi:hypothetical protein